MVHNPSPLNYTAYSVLFVEVPIKMVLALERPKWADDLTMVPSSFPLVVLNMQLRAEPIMFLAGEIYYLAFINFQLWLVHSMLVE